MISQLLLLLAVLLHGASSLDTPPAIVFTDAELSAARAAALERHNLYRCMHGAPPLKYDPAVNKQAQDYSTSMAKTTKYEHSHAAGFGENIGFSMSSTSKSLVFKRPDATDRVLWVIDEWYDEVKDYVSYGKTSGKTAHFTQLVWKESTLLGMGVACRNAYETKEGKTGTFASTYCYMTANYKKPGNVLDKGYHDKNVLARPVKTKEACSKAVGGKGGRSMGGIPSNDAPGSGNSTGNTEEKSTEEKKVEKKEGKGGAFRMNGGKWIVRIAAVVLLVTALEM